MQNRISSDSIFGNSIRWQGDRASSPASTTVSSTFDSVWYALWTVAGASPDSVKV